MNKPQIGDIVIYITPKGNKLPAVVLRNIDYHDRKKLTLRVFKADELGDYYFPSVPWGRNNKDCWHTKEQEEENKQDYESQMLDRDFIEEQDT